MELREREKYNQPAELPMHDSSLHLWKSLDPVHC